MAVRIRLNVRQHNRYARHKGWRTLTDEAQALDLDPATISRVVAGTHGPGERFIAALLHAARDDEIAFEDLFIVREERR